MIIILPNTIDFEIKYLVKSFKNYIYYTLFQPYVGNGLMGLKASLINRILHFIQHKTLAFYSVVENAHALVN